MIPAHDRPLTAARLFWWLWAAASLVWIVVALAVFPQRWKEEDFWTALLATDTRVLTVEGCGHVLDSTVAQGCRQIERMAREREENRRSAELTSAFASLGTVIGPPLLVLALGFLVSVAFAGRLDRQPPPVRPPHPPGPDIRLPPTSYVPPHRRHRDEAG